MAVLPDELFDETRTRDVIETDISADLDLPMEPWYGWVQDAFADFMDGELGPRSDSPGPRSSPS